MTPSTASPAYLVRLVDLVCFVYLVSFAQPNKPDKLNRPENGLLMPAVFFYSLLKHQSEYADIQTMTGIDLIAEFQGITIF